MPNRASGGIFPLMAHDHHHDHAGAQPDPGARTRRALWISLVLNGAFLFVELGLGLITGSLVLLSDATHMVSDVGALALALGAAQLARRAPSPGHSYGWLRAETLGAFTNGLALVVASGIIVKEALERLVHGAPAISPGPVLVAGVLGLGINVGSALALFRADRGNLGVRAALLHMIADAVGSLAAIISAFFLMRGVYVADPLVSLFIAAMVLWGTVGLLREAGRVLLQFAPNGVSPEAVRALLLDIDGAQDVHDLHVWTVDGRTAVLSAHLVAAPGVSPGALRQRAEEVLVARFAIGHTTLQVEGADDCARRDCPLLIRVENRA